MTQRVDAFYRPAEYASGWTARQRAYLLAWRLVDGTVLRLVPTRMTKLRNAILRAFGARLDASAAIHSSCRIYSPMHLTMGPRSCLGPRVDCYNAAAITIGADVTVSQDAFLCTASHDIDSAARPLVTRPITIGDGAWIFARAIVLPGVCIGTGAVVAAGAVVTRDIEPYGVAAGNPARVVRERRYRGAGETG
jgi:putative colanic acid biosynthesis acetyltransferase WcaF